MATSAPSSPVVGSRTNSPRFNRSFRDAKDVGELSQRMRRMADNTKHRRDDADSDDDCCSGTSCCSSQAKTKPNFLRPPAPSRDRSKSPGSVRGLSRGPSPSPVGRGLSRGPSPSPVGRGLSRGPSPSPAGRGPSRGPSPSPAKQAGGATKRPTTNLLAPTSAASRASTRSSPRPSPRPSPHPSPRATPSPRASVSPRASPARHLSSDPKNLPRSRGPSPNKLLRSTSTPTPTPSTEIDLNDPEVLAKIGNRATKTVNKPTRNCDACILPLTEDGCTAFGKVFHKECFRCKGCTKKLDGKFFTKDDSPFCSKCYKSATEQCCVCKQKIVGDCIENNKTYYHPDCMKCSVCEIKLRGSYHFFQNKPICEKDFQETQQMCSKCGEVIDGTYYSLNGNVFCQKDYNEYAESCGGCGDSISGKVIKIKGGSFHPDCFNCQVCESNLVGVPYSAGEDNKIYCPEDFTRKFAALCSVCKKPIVPKEGQTTAPRIRALDRDFHPPCFKCEDCALVLDSRVKGKECWPIRHHVLCYQCYRRRQSESEGESD